MKCVVVCGKSCHPMIKDPKQYWKLVNDLNTEKADPASSPVDPDTWKNYFQTLHSVVDQKFENRLRSLELLLSEKEKTYWYCTFNNLDNRITVKEISSAIASLKNGKAKGLDLISNEMLKGGNAKLLLCLVKLFNLCFSNGYYPDTWANGYISPIFKSDDPD